jgi:hypothetical protein
VTPTPFGGQILSFDFKNDATGKSFNRSFHKLVPTGIYEGLTLDISSDTQIVVNPGVMFIPNKTVSLPLSIRIELTATGNLTVSNANKYIIARFDWQDLQVWYAQITSVSYASILPTDIILGTLVYDGTTLTAIDYSRKSSNIIANLNSRQNNLKVLPSTTPDANVVVNSGTAYINGSYVSYAGGTLALSSVTSGMITLITLDANGTLAKVDSNDTGSPTQPDFPVGNLVLAIITRIGTTSIVTGNQIVNLIIDKISGTKIVKSNSIVLASSDSNIYAKQCADYIIDTSEDAVPIINSYITALNSSGGGSVKCLAGTYNLKDFSTIVLKHNITLEGEGAGTIFKRASSTVDTLFNCININNFILRNFFIDGGGLTYQASGTTRVIYGSLVSENCLFENIVMYDVFSQGAVNGFDSCQNLQNCSGSVTNDYSSGSGVAFHNCNNLVNCIGTGTGLTGSLGQGFSGCNNLVNCTGTGTGLTGAISGFYNCDNLTNCTGTGTGAGTNNYGLGFSNCNNLTNCTGTGNGIGNLNGIGFSVCINAVNCTGVGTGGVSGNGYGFFNCKKLLLNTGIGTIGSAYGFKTCYVDAGTSVPINNGTNNDTADLGWNTGTGN